MRHLELKLILLVILMCLAFASAAYALKPLIFRVEKQTEIEQSVKEFQETVETVQQEAASHSVEITYPTETPKEIPCPELWADMLRYNNELLENRQSALSSKSAYEVSQFKLADYGLDSEVFGIISIPKMDLEMPLYLGASETNMANGAAVLSQTSIPIGGIGTNAVIAGHRGWNGYPYFMNIELLEVGDEIAITNLWRTLTYRVTEIQIVLPDDVDAILIQRDCDMITLLTCHPPNTGGRYRYLVYCERVKDY